MGESNDRNDSGRQFLARGRVLIIDDDLGNLTNLARILVREHDVVALQSARGAIDRIRRGERFDLILSDLEMPEMSGAALFSQIAALDHSQFMRIVAMTGGSIQCDLGVPVLQKPLDTNALRYLVRARTMQASVDPAVVPMPGASGRRL